MSDEPAAADPWQAAVDALGTWTSLTAHEDAERVATGVGLGLDARVELREVTAENVRAVCRLAVAADQSAFVAPNAVSLAEAMFEPTSWYRAIYAGEVPVGFVLMSIAPEPPTCYLWRFMIDAAYQRRGFGRAAIAAIIEHVRGLPGAKALLVSWVPADGGPEPFYLGLGFVPTGEIHDGEVEARLVLDQPG